MKKYLLLVLILAVALITAGRAYADGGQLYSNSPSDEIFMEVVTASTAPDILTPSSVDSNNRLLGYSFTSVTGGEIGIYDDTVANANAGTGVILEDGVVAGDCHTVWFVFPYDIQTSLQVIMSVADGRCTLFYE